MKKVGVLTTTVFGTVMSVKLYHNHARNVHHKVVELAKPYLPTLNDDLLGNIASTTEKGKKTCVIIGGGIAGIASAYELCEKGHNVVLLEKFSDTGLQCSAAPAGGMQRSNPRVDSSMWIAAVKSLLGLAPFQYFRINFWDTLLDPHFVRWFAGFSHNSALVSEESHRYFQNHMLNFTNWAIDDIIAIMKTEGLTEKVGYVEAGALQMFYSQSKYDQAAKRLAGPQTDGETTVMLSRDEMLKAEPCLAKISDDGHKNGSNNLVGGALETTAASGSCLGYTTGLMEVLRKRHKKRFQVESNLSVLDFDTANGNITRIYTNRGTLNVPDGVEIVVCAGSWTPIILRKLDLYCPVYPMKGYNLIVDIDKAGLNKADFPGRVIRDEYIYTSTLNGELRVASFGEFDGWNTELNPRLAKELKIQAGRLFPTLSDLLKSSSSDDNTKVPYGMEIRTGLRPFVCDGRLLLGKIAEYNNLHVNVGPGFNGWKVATGAAKVLASDITGDTSELPGTFETSILSPKDRIKHSPIFCRIAEFFSCEF